MNNFKYYLKFHLVGFIVSVLVGFVVISPNLFFIYNLGNNYRGIYMMNSDAEPHYVSRMAGCLRGNGLNNPYYYNTDQFPTTLFSFSECILSSPARIINVSVPFLNLSYKFIFPTVLFLLVYFFIYRLTKRRLWSVIGGSLILLGDNLISLGDLYNILSLKKVFGQFIHYYRPVNPQFSSILFFSYLHSILFAIRSKKWFWYILSSIIFGISFYIYFYTWTFLLVLSLVMLSSSLFISELRDLIWKNLFLVFASLLLGLYSIFQLWFVSSSSLFSSIVGDYDLKLSHLPIFSLAGVIATVVFIVFFFKKKLRIVEDYFVLSLLLTSLISINQQVITGIVLQSGHYHWYFNTPIYIISLVYVLSIVFRKYFSSELEKWFCLFIFMFSVFSASFVQYSSYIRNFEINYNKQSFSTVFEWLNLNAQNNSVVFTTKDLSELIPIYSRCCYVAYEIHSNYYILPPDRRLYNEEKIIDSINLGKSIPFKIDYVIWPKSSINYYFKNISLKNSIDLGQYYILKISK